MSEDRALSIKVCQSALVQIYDLVERPSMGAASFQADNTAVQMAGAVWS